MKQIKFAFIFLYLTILTQNVIGQSNAYLYIQGDKEKPFYVKIEGKMSNRYGKNYCIFPQLKAGLSKVQILFEQNTIASQEYSIIIPNDAFRAFILTKKDGNYVLYDIHQQFYLKPGDEDHYFANQTLTQLQIVTVEKKNEISNKLLNNSNLQETKEEVKIEESKKEEPKFINNIVINDAEETPTSTKINTVKTENKNEAQPINTSIKETRPINKEIKLESNAAPIYNNNCPTAMRDLDYDELLKNAKAVGKGDKLIKFLLSKISNNCYTTKQVYQLADLMEEEAIVYLYLKRIYPQVSDQQNFHLLESYLFESEEWIKAFRLIH